MELEISNRVIAYEKDRIETTINQLSEGVLITNASGQIIYINKGAENILDISRNAAVGKNIETCIQNKKILSFIKEGKKEQRKLKAQKQLSITHSVSSQTIDGKGTFRFIFSQLSNAAENNLGDLLIMSDVTSQTMAEQARAEFLTHVAHELCSPLSTIKSYTELLMNGDVQDLETQKEFYNVITMETDRLAKLIEDLLNISKIEMGSLSLKKGLVKPVNLLDSCVAAVMSQGVNKNIQIEKLYPDSLSPLDIDKGLMGVALHNILSNALKYTPEGGKISILAEEESAHTLLHIRDTGCGMSEEDLQHIFDKFYRSDDEQVQQQKGTGLGLALTREIITLHGGTIQVESTVGEGSCFSISLSKETNFEQMF
jgi:two-component system sensor histidine kinase VicK